MATSSSSWVPHVEAFVDPDRPTSEQAGSLDALASLLARGVLTLQQLIKDMGAYLATTDNAVRARAILLVAELLSRLERKFLESNIVHSFVIFFSEKLADWHACRGAVAGSLTLLRRENRAGAVTPEDAGLLAMSILENLEVQAMGQQDRILCLELVECLLSRYRQAVEHLGERLLYGICAMIDGEKDPRCLLLAFHIIELLSQLFPDSEEVAAELAMDVFNIISCYFPISFNPPPNDTRGITRDDLSTSLMHAFGSTKLFASFAIPLILEKLSSSLRNAKLDSLKYLGFCSLQYGSAAIQNYAEAIWSSLRREILPFSLETTDVILGIVDGNTGEVIEEAYSCLTLCIRAFQEKNKVRDKQFIAGNLLNAVLGDEAVENFLKSLPILVIFPLSDGDDKCKIAPNNLVEASVIHDSNTKIMSRLVYAACKASRSSCFLVAEKVLQPIVKSIQAPSNFEEKDVLTPARQKFLLEKFQATGSINLAAVEALISIVDATRQMADSMANDMNISESFPEQNSARDTGWLNPLRSLGTKIIIALALLVKISLEKEDGGRESIWIREVLKLGVTGLQSLALFPLPISPVSEEQKIFVIYFLLDIVLKKFHLESVWRQAVTALASICSLEEEFKTNEGIVKVTSLVTTCMLNQLHTQSTLPVQMNIEALALICDSKPHHLLNVITILNEVLCTKFTKIQQAGNGTLKEIVSILQGLSGEILPRCVSQELQDGALVQLITELWSALEALMDFVVYDVSEIITSSMEVLRVAFCNCRERAQSHLFSKLSSAIACKLPSRLDDLSEVDLRPLHIESIRDIWTISLFSSIVAALRPSITPSTSAHVLNLLLRSTVSDLTPIAANAVFCAVASLVNKLPAQSNAPQKHLESKKLTLEDSISFVMDAKWMRYGKEKMEASKGDVSDGVEEENKRKIMLKGIELTAWVGKALAMRGHASVSDIAIFLLRLIQCKGDLRSDMQGDNVLFSSLWPTEKEEVAISMAASDAFGIILQDLESPSNKIHHAVVRPLYKQRFFNSMLPALLHAVQETFPAKRVMIYRAFTHLISAVPSVVYLPESKKVLLLILESLSGLSGDPRNSEQLFSLLLALSAILIDENNGKTIAAEHVPAVVNRLIALIGYLHSMMVRETSLQCLIAVADLPYARVFPVRKQVLNALSLALNDPKRIVRREAIRCKQAWSAIGR